MPKTITREKLQAEMDSSENMQLIEVLGPESFQEYHLPGAINIPISSSDFDERVQAQIPSRETPIVVYCKDSACDASPKAAKRLERLGYTHVYDYEAGKEDWRESGNSIEKAAA